MATSCSWSILIRMTFVIWASGVFLTFTLLLHLISALVAAYRCRPEAKLCRPTPVGSDISIVRPLCGLDHGIEQTLRSTFSTQTDADIVFCVASPNDNVIPLVRRLIAEHPRRNARLLIGDNRISVNPKLNNMYKGWVETTTRWVIFADSNVLMPPDYLERLFGAWKADTGLVCAPPIGCEPDGFWAEVECATLNTYQARWQYFADAVGYGFAQGKSMLWRRDHLEQGGGIDALAREVAEDAASTKVIRAAGLRVRLVNAPFGQPLGRRTAAEVWKRQVRWAQLRRASFPAQFAPEILSNGFAPLVAAAVFGLASDTSVIGMLLLTAAIYYGAEMVMAAACGWHLSWRTPLTALARDLATPFLYVQGWRDTGFSWRGNAMRVDGPERPATALSD